MKNLIIINGAPGVGKTTVGKLLFQSLPRSIFLDGDDVWQINPFVVNDETKTMVQANIVYCLKTFLQSSYENIIFVWVLHQQSIIDDIIRHLSGLEFKLSIFTLIVDETTLINRLNSDKNSHRRPEIALDRLKQSLKLNTTKIDCSYLSPVEIKNIILTSLNYPATK